MLGINRINMALRGTINRTFIRNYSSDTKHVDKGQIAKAEKMWKMLSLFVGLPSVIIAGINTYIREKEHMEHFERPPFIKYDHMRLMKKPFPWGDGKHSLFFNPHVNALPDGYEDEL